MAISQNFPAIRPTLNLNFARSKILDPRITFTRASTATYVDREGIIRTAVANQARFNHDPATGESLGLLIEESRTNNQTNSQPQSGSFTGGDAIITYNTAIAPNGATEACRIARNGTTTSSSFWRATRSINFNANTMVLSCWAKGSSGNNYFVWSFQNLGGAIVRAGFLLTGDGETSIITNGNGGHTLQIEKYPDGWYRCIIIGNTQSSGTTTQFLYTASAYSEASSAIGGSTLVWGFQLEQGSFPTSYIPTSGSAVTRSADLASISGSSFSNFYNPVEGTAYIDLISNGVNADGAAYQVYFNFNSDASNRWGIGHQNESRGSLPSNAVLPYVGQAGVFDTITRFSKTFVPGSRNKYAMTQPNGSDVKITGTGTGGFTSGITSKVPATSQLYLGQVISDNGNLNGTIAEFRYYPQELTPDQITTLIK